MDAFQDLIDNAQHIFDVARADSTAEPNDFALLIRPDGGLHFVMEAPLSLEAAAIYGGARTAYRVTKTSDGGVRVSGRSGNQECVLEQHGPGVTKQKNAANRFTAELLRDQPLYWITSPLTLAAAS